MTTPSENRRVLAFFAHPDDAEFLCVGTLIRLSSLGWEIHIASATPGDYGTMVENRWDIASRRTQEATKSASLIGATYHCLGESDALVVYDKPTLQKCYDLFRRVAPSLVFTHPERDYMMDHEMVAKLARAASFVYGAPNCSAFPLREGTRIPYLYYSDPVEAIDPNGRRVEPTTWVDITAQMELKTRMLATHASQRDWLLAHHGGDEYLDSMRRHAALRGAQVGIAAAEAFVQHRGHAYPKDDLLASLFSGGPTLV